MEQMVKDLQAQNAQFQQALMNLAKGQEDLETLFTKERKKKRKYVILNVRIRSKGHAQLVQKEYASSKDSQEEEAGSIRANISTDDNDSSEERYPPADEKYKQLEDRLKVMEI